jgi:acetyl esterase/lipase
MWFLRARPVDHAIAISTTCAALPVVGKHLEPLGALTAMSAWGFREAPGFLRAALRSRSASRSPDLAAERPVDLAVVSEAALQGIVAAERQEIDWPVPDRVAPVLRGSRQRREYLHRSSVRYGDAPQQLLDVWRRRDLPPAPAPVLIFVPGGAWIFGSRKLQGYALMAHLAAQGWVCLSIGYRVSPHHRWPRHVMDVKAAVAWARANVDQFGGDRDFVAITGSSAGGHLAALTALTPGDGAFQGDLPPDADTSVDAVVGIYGRYDWEDRSTKERDRFVDFLEHIVVKRRYCRHRDVYRAASPIARVHPDAPPFMVVHGSADTVIPVAQAQSFVEKLRATSRSTVGYLELPGAGHGFDMLDGARTGAAVTVIGVFLNEIHRRHSLSRADEVV